MYFDFARPDRDWRLSFIAIATVAVCLTGCVTKETNVSRESQVGIAPVRLCTVGELQRALEDRERGYNYPLQCS